MSEKFFYDNFFQTLIELHEQIQLEQWPASVGPDGKSLQIVGIPLKNY